MDTKQYEKLKSETILQLRAMTYAAQVVSRVIPQIPMKTMKALSPEQVIVIGIEDQQITELLNSLIDVEMTALQDFLSVFELPEVNLEFEILEPEHSSFDGETETLPRFKYSLCIRRNEDDPASPDDGGEVGDEDELMYKTAKC